jgi:hypothetical protein
MKRIKPTENEAPHSSRNLPKVSVLANLTTFPSITIQTGGGSFSAHLVDIELEILLGERNRFGCQV